MCLKKTFRSDGILLFGPNPYPSKTKLFDVLITLIHGKENHSKSFITVIVCQKMQKSFLSQMKDLVTQSLVRIWVTFSKVMLAFWRDVEMRG